MSAFTLQPGDAVQYNRHAYRIRAAVSLTTVRIEDCGTGQTLVVPVTALEASEAQTSTSIGDDIFHAPDIMQIAEADWAEAKRRAQILAPVATMHLCPQSVVQQAAAEIGCSVRHLYTLLRAYRASGGTLSALVPSKHSGGKGKGRLSADLEAIIATTIQEEYLTPQKRMAQRIVDEVRRRCHRAKLPPPADNTVRRRLHALRADDTLRRREGASRARQKFDPVPGTFPPPSWPLAVVQIDHTPVDLIVVDEQYRRPIGRPYLTVAIDVYSRCIPGFAFLWKPPRPSRRVCASPMRCSIRKPGSPSAIWMGRGPSGANRIAFTSITRRSSTARPCVGVVTSMASPLCIGRCNDRIMAAPSSGCSAP